MGRTRVGRLLRREWPKDFTVPNLHSAFSNLYLKKHGHSYEPTNRGIEFRKLKELQAQYTNYQILEGMKRGLDEGVMSLYGIEDYIPERNDEPVELYELRYLVEQTGDKEGEVLLRWLIHAVSDWFTSRLQVTRDPRMQQVKDAIERIYSGH